MNNITILLIALCLTACSIANNKTKKSERVIACTMDAMQCPDGSWVGRTGTECKFICPAGNK